MRNRARTKSLALLIGTILFGNAALPAASVTYDADISIPGAQDGAGLGWNTANGNWWNGNADVLWPNTAVDEAIIGAGNGAAGTITVGTVTANRLLFKAPGSGNYSLSGGTLTLGGTMPFVFSEAGQAPIIGSVLAGTGGMTKTGTGTLALTANNTLTGGISVNEGILILNTPGMAFNNANGSGGGPITVNPGATLRLASDFNAGYNRPFLLNGGTLNTTSGTASDGNNYLNVLTLQNGATVSGNGLRVGNFSNPSITVTGGTASTIASPITLVNGSTINLTLNVANVTGDANTDLTISGAILDFSGLGGTTITKTGSGTLRLASTTASNNSGGWIVNGGTVVATLNAGAGGGNAASFGSGPITVNAGATITGSVAFSVSGGNAVTRVININGGTWDASYVSTGGEYVRTLNLTGGKIASTSLGNYLRVSNSGQLALNSLASANTSTIQMGIDITYQSILATVAAGTTTNGVDLWIQGAITENTGAGTGAKSITKAGAGKLLLTGANTYTGTTTISAGTLEIGNQGTLGAAGIYAGSIVSNATLQFASTANQTLSGIFSGTGNIIQRGAGTLTISNAANTYTGNLTVNAGTMVISGGIAAPVTVNGGTLNLTGTSTSTVTVNAGGILTGTGSTTGDIALSNGAGILAGAAAVQGGSVTTTGTTNVYVTGTPTGLPVTVDVIRYAGGTSPLAGLSPATNYRAGAYTDDATKIQLTSTAEAKTWNSTTGGTWETNGATSPWTGGSDGNFFWGDAVTFAGSVNQTVTLVGALAPSAVTFANTANTITLAGTGSITGPTAVTYSGAGVVVGTINTYTGVTTIANGANLVTVASIGNAGTPGNLGLNPTINLGAGGAAGTLNYTGPGETTDRVLNFNGTGGGAFINNNGAGVLRFTSNTTTTGSGAKGTFYGGTGTLQLDGNISALGGLLNMTKNDVGTLTLGGIVSTAGGAFNLNNGTVNFNGTMTTTGNFTSGSASISNINGTASFGALTVSTTGANSSTMNVNSGGTLNTSGAVLIGQNANTTAGVLNISGTFNAASTDFRIGNAAGNATTASGTVTLNAGGLLNLPTANTSLWVSSGTVTNGTLNLNGGTLILNGQIRNDTGAVGGVNPGTSTLNLNGGTLKAAGNSATFINTIDTVNVRNGGAIFDTNGFAVTVPDSLDHSIIGGDSAIDGGLTKHGAGTLTLSAANTFTGNTTINTGTLALAGLGTLGNGSYAGAIANFGTLQYSSSVAQTISGVISGNGALVKDTDATSVLTLTGANTYTGTTTINAGTLVVNNTSYSGTGTAAVLVNTGGTLAGNGFIIGSVNVTGGTLAPGNSIDSLDTGTLSFTGGTFAAEINTSTLAADLVNVTGDLNLSGSPALLMTDLGSDVPLALGTVFTLIDYSGAWNLGTFAGLLDDSSFTFGANTYKIDYNDPAFGGTALTLTVQAIPEPSSLILLALGGTGICLLRRKRQRVAADNQRS